jgi:hypothetical protein
MASLLLNPKCSNKRVIHTVSKQGQSFEILSDCLILTFNKPLIEIWSKTNVRQLYEIKDEDCEAQSYCIQVTDI